MTRITLIAAVGRNGVIGDGRGLLWHLPEDLAFFKRTTLGHPMLMGRATFDSIGRVLPGRRTIVLTRNPQWHHADVETAHSFAEALALAGPAAEVFVCGGGQVYAEALPFAHRLLLTEVDQAPDPGAGAVRFPDVDATQWQEVSREPHDGFSFVAHERHRATHGRR
jgi:dihydrofolate reductase